MCVHVCAGCQKHYKHKQLQTRLQNLLCSSSAESQPAVAEVLDYFMKRLGSPQSSTRRLASNVSTDCVVLDGGTESGACILYVNICSVTVLSRLITATTVLLPLYRSACVSRHLQLRTVRIKTNCRDLHRLNHDWADVYRNDIYVSTCFCSTMYSISCLFLCMWNVFVFQSSFYWLCLYFATNIDHILYTGKKINSTVLVHHHVHGRQHASRGLQSDGWNRFVLLVEPLVPWTTRWATPHAVRRSGNSIKCPCNVL